jgi:hypothetical protein
MPAVDYVLGLTSVMIALALTDMGMSFHRLVRRTQSVRWDPVAIMAAVTVACEILLTWASMWWARPSLVDTSAGLLATVMLELFLLYLLAAAALPDEPSGAFDLRVSYHQSARYLWTLYALLHMSAIAHTSYLWWWGGMPTRAFELNLVGRGPPVPAAVVLALWPRSRKLHWILVTALTLFALGMLLLVRI